MFDNPAPAAIDELFRRMHTIAVLGLSPKPNRPSYGVAKAMQGFGFRIIPVRPMVQEILGERVYPALDAIPERVDVVNVFRAGEYLDAIVDECIRLHMPALWIQEGIVNESAARRARDAGLVVVMDRCLYKDYVARRT